MSVQWAWTDNSRAGTFTCGGGRCSVGAFNKDLQLKPELSGKARSTHTPAGETPGSISCRRARRSRPTGPQRTTLDAQRWTLNDGGGELRGW